MPYFDEDRNPVIKAKVMSAIPLVEIREVKLVGYTTVKLRNLLPSRKCKLCRITSRDSFPTAGAKASSSRKSRPAMKCCMFIFEIQSNLPLK